MTMPPLTEGNSFSPVPSHMTNESSEGIRSTLPIDRLKVFGVASAAGGSKLTAMLPANGPASLTTTSLTANQETEVASLTPSRQQNMTRRYEQIRRNLTRTEKTQSPTFVVEGRKVTQKTQPATDLPTQNGGEIAGDRVDLESTALLDDICQERQSKMPTPQRSRFDPVTSKTPQTSVVPVSLPMLYIEGPGFSHQLRSKSTSLPDDHSNLDMDDVANDSTQSECIWSDIYDTNDHRIHRLMKRSNLFHGSSRIGDDVSDLCIENTQRPRTINLQLKASGHENRPRLHPALGVHPATSHTTRMSREKLYKSATQLSLPRPLFHSINSYLNFNNSKAASLYGSEQYVDSSEQPDILKPLENKPQFKPLNRMLVAKYSDMEIQKELSDFFKVRPVKSWDAQS